MELLFTLLRACVAALIAFGALMFIASIRKKKPDFLKEAYGADFQYAVAIATGVLWPILAPLVFAILLAVYLNTGGKDAN